MDDASNNNSKIISDSSITEQKEDKFGHYTFVQWLLSRIDSAKEPLNIGIFGKWGVGKTGILQMFESALRVEQIKNINYVHIDCWKLTPQSLREQLLISIDKKLGGKKEQEIRNRLYNVTSISMNLADDEKWNEKITRLLKLSKPYLILAGITISSGAILDWVIPNTVIPDNYLLPLVGSTFLIPLIANLSSRLAENSMSLANTVKQVIPPIQSPIEFEKLFNEILEQKKSDNKLVIALDNLDRCEGNLVIDTISMVKSFMEHDNVIFIVPCDDDAIIKHLVNIRKFEPDDAREFLRKFFQATVEVPPFLVGNIIDYTDELVKENNIPANEKVKYVLSIAAMDNPRRIKQFLNNFAANLDLSKEREKSFIKENTITSNPEFLAKILVLRDQFPDFYKALLEDENILYYIEKYFQNIPVPDANMGIIMSHLENKKLENFLRQTRQIEVDDVLPFIKFGQESREKTLDEYTAIQENTRFCNVEFISKFMDESNDKPLVTETILETVKNDIKQRRLDFGFNGLKILLSIIPKLEDNEKKHVIDTFGTLTSSKKEILEKLHYFENNQIFNILADIPERYRKTILESYCELLGKLGTFDDELLELIFKNKEFMTFLAEQKFAKSFTQLYTSQEPRAKQIIEKHFVGIPERIDLLEPTLLEHVVGQILPDNLKPENKNRVEFYLKIKSRANNAIKNKFLDKLLLLLIKNPQPTVEPTARYILDQLLLLELNDVTKGGTEKIISIFSVRYNSAQGHDQKLEFLKPMIKFMSLLSKKSLETFVNTIIVGTIGWPMPFLNNILGELEKSNVNILEFPNIQNQLINRMKSENSNIAHFLLTQSNNDQKEVTVDAIIYLISKGAEPQLSNALTAISSNTDNFSSYENNFATAIITRMISVPLPERQKFFNVLFSLHSKCVNDIKNEIYNTSLELIKQKEPHATFAVNNYEKIWSEVDDERKKFILEKIITIVKGGGVLDQNHVKPIDFIMKNQSILPSESFEQFVEFLLVQNKIDSPDITRKIVLESIIKIPKPKEFSDKILENVKNMSTVGKPELTKLKEAIIGLN